MTPIAVFIESNTTGSGRDFVIAAERLTLLPHVLVADRARYATGYLDDVAEIVDVDTSDDVAVLAACKRLGDVALVWSSSELFAGTAARAAAALGLRGGDAAAIERCRDKAAQADALRAAGRLVPSTVVVRDGHVADIVGLTGPVVAKPVRGTGSTGVRRFETAAGAIPYARELARADGAALIQTLVVGPEYSVELMNAQPVAVLRKTLSDGDGFIEIGHDFAGDASTPETSAICDAAVAAARALGVTFGPIHVELRDSCYGPVVIEVNPRLAGGHIPAVVQLALGVDLVTATLRELMSLDPRVDPLRAREASVRFVLAPAAGVVDRICGVAAARAVDGVATVNVLTPRGRRVHVGDFRQRAASVLAVGTEEAGAADIAAHAAALLRPVVYADD